MSHTVWIFFAKCRTHGQWYIVDSECMSHTLYDFPREMQRQQIRTVITLRASSVYPFTLSCEQDRDHNLYLILIKRIHDSYCHSILFLSKISHIPLCIPDLWSLKYPKFTIRPQFLVNMIETILCIRFLLNLHTTCFVTISRYLSKIDHLLSCTLELWSLKRPKVYFLSFSTKQMFHVWFDLIQMYTKHWTTIDL